MNVDVTNTQQGGNEPVATPQDFKANIKPQQEEQSQPAVENTAAANPVVETESVQPTQEETPTPPVVSNIPVEPVQENIHELPLPIDVSQMSQVNTSNLEGTIDDHKIPEVLPTDKEEQHQEGGLNFIPADAIQNFNTPKDEEGDTQASGIIVPRVEHDVFNQVQEINKLAGITRPTLPTTESEKTITPALRSETTKPEEKLIPELVYEKGQANFKNGTYNGILAGGIPHGQGELTLNNGTIVTGSFLNGVADGNATIVSPDGSGYYGGVKNGIADGVGTYISKDGNTQHGTFENGKFVSPIAEKAEYAKASKKENNIQTAFKNTASTDYSEVYKDNNVTIPIAKPIQENTAQYAFNAMNKISHKEVSIIGAISGVDIALDKNKELDKVNSKSALQQLNAVLTPEVKKLVANGGKLTPAQKQQIEKALQPYTKQTGLPSNLEDIKWYNYTQKNHELLGDYNDLASKDTATVLKLAYGFAKKGHSYLDELNKPVVKPVNVEDQQIINRKRQVNEVKQAINPTTGKVYGKEVNTAVDFISSSKYSQYIKQELEKSDGKVGGAKLQYHLNKAYSQWLKDTGASEGWVSRDAFNNTIGRKITKLHDDLIADIRTSTIKNPNNFGYAAAQKVIDRENDKLRYEKADLTFETHGKVSPYYVNQKTKQEQEIISKHTSTLNQLKQTASSTYQQSLKALSQSNPQIKSVSDDYSQKILHANSDEEKSALAKEMQNKLSSFPEFKELNDTYNAHLNTEISKLNSATSSALIQNSAKARDAYMKDFSKQYSAGLQALYKKSGYLAQYNSFVNSDRIIQSNQYKKASYQQKKTLTEKSWNEHVSDATKYFSQKELRQPANEYERNNVHFSAWTGKERPRTSEDLAAYKSMISKGAHDKFRVFMNYNELTNEKQNTFQVKALLEDKLAEANSNIEYLKKSLGDNYKHHEDWAKWNDMKRNCEKGLAATENEKNDANAFLKGIFEGDVPFLGSIVKIHDANNLSDASERYANGTANRADAGLLISKNIKDTLSQLAPQSFSHEIGTGLANTVSFMLEMAATSGFGELGFAASKATASGVLSMVKKTAEKTVLATALENPKTISFLSNLASLTAKGTGQLGKVVAMTTLMPTTGASIAERNQQKVSPQFYLAHIGGLDPAIAQMSKGTEGWFESGLKAYGISASAIIAEMSGGKLLGAIDNAAQKPIIDYMSTNQFLKRTMIGNYMRKKGFTTTEELSNFIGEAMSKGRITSVHHEIFENWVEQGLTNIVEGEDLTRGFTAKEQGHSAIATALTTGFLKGAKLGLNKGRNILIKSDPISTNVIYDGSEGEKLTVPMNTDIWNRFNKVVAKKQFDSEKFNDFVEENKLSLSQEQALANVYVKVNPTAHENIDAITNHVKEVTKEDVTHEEIMGGNVEVINQKFEEPKLEQSEEDLTPREREEQVKISEERDAKIQSAIDEENEYLKSSIKGGLDAEYGKEQQDLLANNPIEYFKGKAQHLGKYMPTRAGGGSEVSATEINEHLNNVRERDAKFAREYTDIVAALREQQKEKQAKTETNDNQNQAGIPSEVGTTEESIQGQPIQETGSQATETSGVVQKPSEDVDIQKADIEKRKQEELDSVDVSKGGKLPIEGYEEFYKKINAKYDAELAALDQTDGNVQPTTEPSAKTTEGETVQSTAEPTASKGNVEINSPEDDFWDNLTKEYNEKLNNSTETRVPEKEISRAPEKKKSEIQQAREINATSPYEAALKYFIEGGKMSSAALQNLYGTKNKQGLKGEHKSRLNLVNNKKGKTLDGIAHVLWEAHSETMPQFDTSDYKDAIEQVVNSHTSMGNMAKELISKKDNSPEYAKATSLIDGMTDEEINRMFADQQMAELNYAETFNAPEVKVTETKETLITDETKQKAMEDKLNTELQSLPIVETKKNNNFTKPKSEIKKLPAEEQNLINDINENFDKIIEQAGIKKINCK